MKAEKAKRRVSALLGAAALASAVVVAAPPADAGHRPSELWIPRWVPPGSLPRLATAALDPTGERLVVAGYERSTGWLLSAVDARTGAQIWATVHPHADSLLLRIAIDPGSGRIVAAGSMRIAATETFTVAAYDVETGAPRLGYDARTGARLWAVLFDGYDVPITFGGGPVIVANRRVIAPYTGDDQASAIVAHPDGHRIYVAGGTRGVGASRQWATIGYLLNCPKNPPDMWSGPVGAPLHGWIEPYVGPKVPMGALICLTPEYLA